MTDTADGDPREVAGEIVRYLRAHPDAADTLEGAARWWLRQRPCPKVMEQAMALLVAQGVVEGHVLPDGTTVFRYGRRQDTRGADTS